jgi:hypothetical protein
MTRFTSIFFLLLVHADVLLGSADELPIEAVTSTNPSGDFLPTFVVFLVALLCVALMVSSRYSYILGRFFGGYAGNLFLAIKFRELKSKDPSHGGTSSTVEMGPSCIGHLLSLSMKSATFVSPVSTKRGVCLRLFLDSLPEFPAAKAVVSTQVSRCKSLKCDPPAFLVKVHFVDLTVEKRYPILHYLKHLSTNARIKSV